MVSAGSSASAGAMASVAVVELSGAVSGVGPVDSTSASGFSTFVASATSESFCPQLEQNFACLGYYCSVNRRNAKMFLVLKAVARV